MLRSLAISLLRGLFGIVLLGSFLVPVAAETNPAQSPVDFSQFGGANTPEDSEEMWLALREREFGEREITENAGDLIELSVPSRAENDALVPVQINLERFQQAKGNDPVKKLYLIVDVNPAPLGGVFTLNEGRNLNQLNTQIRVNGYTYVRVVVETVSGRLYMTKHWVKNTGAGCSAPPGIDQESHQKKLGNMRFKLLENDSVYQSKALRLMISHPNNTGMQKDQLTTLMIPEHYVTNVSVTFNDESLLEAETTFTMSENPNFTFNFEPSDSGILRAKITDSKNNTFMVETEIKAGG